jgi:predicted nucleotidyltransferase
MAEVLDKYVVSDLPDLTRISLEDLPTASVPHALAVLDRAIEHPAQDQQDQQR